MKRKSPKQHKVTRNGKTFTRGTGSAASKNSGKEYSKVKTKVKGTLDEQYKYFSGKAEEFYKLHVAHLKSGGEPDKSPHWKKYQQTGHKAAEISDKIVKRRKAANRKNYLGPLYD